ncbi:MAG: NAD-dependent succinate-semialdehyde dehydrogenase [Candidatus Dojkabacteria bacterium]|nr:MAG: NAD-dependent succinate-semialdehyde dehydrogenase [Candidatus Dojkabacteria bacterium]
MAIQSLNPYSGELLREFTPLTELELTQKIAFARKKHFIWKEFDYPQRAQFLRLLAGFLERRKGDLAKLMAVEMGKLYTEGVAEIEKCVFVCNYYADNGATFLADEQLEDGYVMYEPLGVVLGVMPWNFPFWQVMRFAAPALMAGNTILLKHASNVPQCAIALEDAFNEVKFPPAVFQSLLIGSDMVERVVRDPAVRAVSLTGSEVAGSTVARAAGESLKKCVLELGGSDPAIVMEDADLDLAVEQLVMSRARNAGQSCIAAKRFIVHESVHDQFVMKFKSAMEKLRYGDPLSSETSLAPLASASALERLEEQVVDSIHAGAKVVTGGKRYPGNGFGYQPTILIGVNENMPVFNEEAFGPVAAVIKYGRLEDALALANKTKYGLGASIWSRNEVEAKRLVRRLDVGVIAINKMVQSDPAFPFGGVKGSGYGRELGRHGILEFVNVKSVSVG